MPSLNPRQREAVRYIDGPLLVLAGAGSGKTRVITRKIAYLIGECGIAPRHIAAVTFTNKAAREMKGRVASLLKGSDTKGLTISTFHTLGLNILRRETTAAGLRGGFSIFDDQDTRGLLDEIAHKQAPEAALPDGLQWRIGGWKNALVSPEQALAAAQDGPAEHAARLYAAYQRSLRAYNAVDFDDLIGLPVQLFETQPEVRERWQGRVRYLLVDEYQDTNAAQYRLVRLLTGVAARLTAVGDDDQSVYAWRGARPENLKLLQDDFPTLKLVKLEQNYRSTGRILKAANALIAHNPHVFEKTLWSDLGFGDPLRVMRARHELHEAEWVVSEIVSHRFRARTAYRDYAILYRGNHQARLLERVLREQRAPYFLSGGSSFFARGEVRDVIGYLRLLANPEDDSAFLRVVNTPRREIGPTTLEQLGDYAARRGVSLFAACREMGLEQHMPARRVARLRAFCDWLEDFSQRARQGDAAAVARETVESTGYRRWLEDTSPDPKAAERRMQNVDEVLDWMARLMAEDEAVADLAGLVARMTLMDILERDDEENDSDRVSLMTLHAAKGLEFPHVFVVGLEEDLLPHHASQDEAGLQEERRLAYVGLTRAQRTLTLSYAARRKRFGEWRACAPSRFIAELPAEDLEWRGTDAQVDPQERQEKGRAHLANLRDLLKG